MVACPTINTILASPLGTHVGPNHDLGIPIWMSHIRISATLVISLHVYVVIAEFWLCKKLITHVLISYVLQIIEFKFLHSFLHFKCNISILYVAYCHWYWSQYQSHMCILLKVASKWMALNPYGMTRGPHNQVCGFQIKDVVFKSNVKLSMWSM